MATVADVVRIRVATFNIRNGLGCDGWSSWPFRRRTTARTLAALQADVCGLQEVYAFQQRYLARLLPSQRFVGAGRDDGERGERCPVVVRADAARVVSARTRWFGATPDVPGTRLPGARFPRIATTVRLELAGGAVVDVTSTHLDESSAERRRRSAAQLVAAMDRAVPQVLLGDLNADPGSDVVDELRSGGLEPVAHQRDLGTEHRFTGSTSGRRIDHILVSGGVRPVHAQVFTARLGRRLPSDHHPVVALVDVPSPWDARR